MKLITSRKDQDKSSNSKTQYELNTEIKNLNTKLKFEQAQRDELKRKYEVEISAAKIRYDNELQKQNRLMQTKNTSLMQEITRLNESIKKLQEEKNTLLLKMKNSSEFVSPSNKFNASSIKETTETNSKVSDQ